MGFSGTPKDMGPPYGKRDPYYSHISRDSYGSAVGIVWEAYHKGVPLLGVPGITLEKVGLLLPPIHFPNTTPMSKPGNVMGTMFEKLMGSPHFW